jgi:hypothetical protein
MKALVVLLLMLNIGFAAWQLTRHEVPPARRPPADAGVEPLRLLTEIAKPLPAKESAQPSQVSAPPPAAPEPTLP